MNETHLEELSHTVAQHPSFLFGRLVWGSIPWHEPILMVTMSAVILAGIALLGYTTYKKAWGWIWRDWLTSVDHKKLGMMYLILAIIMLFRGFSDAIMMVTNQALSLHGMEYLPPEHFDQVFTAHGVIMIFFVATPLWIALANFAMPLQIGARDVAYPFMNLVSFWFTAAGAILINLSLFIGRFAATGWLAYTPLSGIHFSPGVGPDYWIWALQISGIGTTLTAVNFIATIIKSRAPGMKMMEMPVFVWTVFCASLLALIIFPIFTATVAMLTLDRYYDFHFFTNSDGGNQMMWVNLIWAWGHPEVYFLVLPAFGAVSEVTATFSRKPLFGYVGMVWATIAITFLSFMVWLHHFFTMGAGAAVNAFFGIMTMIIAIPTGVKIYNWIFTMYRGKIVFSAAMWWVMAFLLTFTVGGMTGVMLAIPTNDYVLHNSMFLVAHFHNVIIGGVVYGLFAGMTYWWPKLAGYKLNETLGKWACSLWFIGFLLAWLPKYFAGLNGMTRRLYAVHDQSMALYLYVSVLGVAIIFAGILVQFYCFYYSYVHRFDDAQRDDSGDPWNARTLEWYTATPIQEYNFAVIPEIHGRDEFVYMKKHGTAFKAPANYEPIHMPRNAWEAPVIGVAALLFGFAFIWHIWWLVVIGFFGIVIPWLMHAFDKHKDYYIPADEVKHEEEVFHDHVQAAMQKPDFAMRPLTAKNN